MPFACIYIPNFPVAAALRAEPELRNCALAIFEGKAPLEKIAALNGKASRMGISPGMTKAQAELCSALALRSRSTLQESSAHAAMLDCAQSFSPCVEDTAWDTALLDLAGMESLFGSLPEISRTMANRATELGLSANIAVAGNPDAAMIAARGFPGVTVISEGKEAEQLGSLPLDVLFANQFEPILKKDTPTLHTGGTTQRDFRWVGNSQGNHPADHSDLLETLERWGIGDLRALAALPEPALSERLGQEGLRLRRLARGSTSRPLVPIEEPLVFEEAIELEQAIVLLEPLAFLLHRLLEQICARLGSHALATQELHLTLDLSNFAGVEDEFENLGIASESNDPFPDTVLPSGADTSRSEACAESKDLYLGPSASKWRRHRPGPTKFARKLSLPLPMLDPKLFLKLLQLDLNANPPGAPITKIHLAAVPARPRSAQSGLFQPPSPEPEKLELTLARISSMVGENKVGAIEWLDTHHPAGFRMRRFACVARVPSPSNSSLESGPEEQAPVTALRRFRPPLRADVTLENGQPARVHCRKKEVRGNVLWKAGPWRSSGDWWDREPWSRDEWDIGLQSDTAKKGESLALFRLVHDPLGGGWFVEGMYD
jgi:protein ImuB